ELTAGLSFHTEIGVGLAVAMVDFGIQRADDLGIQQLAIRAVEADFNLLRGVQFGAEVEANADVLKSRTLTRSIGQHQHAARAFTADGRGYFRRLHFKAVTGHNLPGAVDVGFQYTGITTVSLSCGAEVGVPGKFIIAADIGADFGALQQGFAVCLNQAVSQLSPQSRFWRPVAYREITAGAAGMIDTAVCGLNTTQQF